MARPPNYTTTYEHPRISANELAKYMLATETGKIGIIRNAKSSSAAPRIRYKPAKNCIKNFLASENRDVTTIHETIARLEQRSADTALSAFARDDAAKSIDALNSFITLRNQMGGFDYVKAPARGQAHLMLGGVDVSINIDLFVHRTYRNTAQIGGAIFRFTQADSETPAAISKREDINRYAATLAHMQIAENMAGNRTPHRALSMAVDVQFGQAIQCPSSYAQRSQNLENACRFIAAMWDSV